MTRRITFTINTEGEYLTFRSSSSGRDRERRYEGDYEPVLSVVNEYVEPDWPQREVAMQAAYLLLYYWVLNSSTEYVVVSLYQASKKRCSSLKTWNII